MNNTSGKGPWSLEEDQILLRWVDAHGASKWSLCSDTIPGRSGKQCRERWFNNLDPDVKKGNWSADEDDTIFQGYLTYGSSWSRIAKSLEGRTENSVKNRFYSTVRKLLSDSHETHEGQSSEQQIRNIIEKTLGKKVGANVERQPDAVQIKSSSVVDSDSSAAHQQQSNKLKRSQKSSLQGSPEACDGLEQEDEDDEYDDEDDENSDDQESGYEDDEEDDDEEDDDDDEEDDDSENDEEIDDQMQQQQQQQEQMQALKQQHSKNLSNPSLNEIAHGMQNAIIKKRKYKKKKQESEYCEQNLLYRLLKSNDVTIKNTKCLQDYSIFYKKYKLKKNLTNRRRRLEKQLKLKNTEEQKSFMNLNEETQQQQFQQASSDEHAPLSSLQSSSENNLIEQSQSKQEDPFSIATDKILSKKELKASQKNGQRLSQSIQNASLECKQFTQLNNQSTDPLGNMQQELMQHFQKSIGSFLKKFVKKSKAQQQPTLTNVKHYSSQVTSADQLSEQVSQRSCNSVSDLESLLGQDFQEQISKQMAFAVANAVADKNTTTCNSRTYSEISNDSYNNNNNNNYQPNALNKQNKDENLQMLNSRRGLPAMQNLHIPNTNSSEEKSESTPLIGQQRTNRHRLLQQFPTLSRTQMSSPQRSIDDNSSQNKQILNHQPRNWDSQSSTAAQSRNNSNSSRMSQQQNSSLHAGDYYQNNNNNQIGSATSLWSNNSTQVPPQRLHQFQQLQQSSSIYSSQSLQSPRLARDLPRAAATSNPAYTSQQMKNMSISNLRELIKSSLNDSNSQATTAETNPLEQQDKKMMFLLNQMNTLEKMLINTKKELVKLETGSSSTSVNESSEPQKQTLINRQPSSTHQQLQPRTYADPRSIIRQNNGQQVESAVSQPMHRIQGNMQQQFEFDTRNRQTLQGEVKDDYGLQQELQQFNKFEAPAF